MPSQAGRYAGRIGDAMFVIAVQRDNVTMYLLTLVPVRWSTRERAMRFHTAGEARRAAVGIKIAGAWSIEPA
jgi:hypothetical protein